MIRLAEPARRASMQSLLMGLPSKIASATGLTSRALVISPCRCSPTSKSTLTLRWTRSSYQANLHDSPASHCLCAHWRRSARPR